METKRCVIDIETTSFYPWTGKLICIGIKDIECHDTRIFQHWDERTQLIKFLRFFNNRQFDEIIGFNIGFDMRFLIAKCIQHQLPAQYLLDATTTDLMMILKGFGRKYNFNKPGTLDEWSRSLLGKGKTLDNHQIPSLFREGRIQEIIDYNRNDVEITYELWKKITNIVGVSING